MLLNKTVTGFFERNPQKGRKTHKEIRKIIEYRLFKGKPIVDLERDGFHQTISAQDMLHE